MTVQLHYYGSVFDLDPEVDDRFWTDFIEEALRDTGTGTLVVTLTDGLQASIPVFPGVPLVVVEPQEDFPGEHTTRGSVYWADGTTLRAADDDA
jgi:hypothetical protein